MAYARQARFPALPRFRGALYFLRSEEQRSEQAKPKSEAGGKARRSSFILPPSPYSYNNTLRSCYNGGSLRSCSQPRPRRGRVRLRPRDSLPASPLASSPSVPPIYRLFYCPLPRRLHRRRGRRHPPVALAISSSACFFLPSARARNAKSRRRVCWPSRTWSKRWACLKSNAYKRVPALIESPDHSLGKSRA